MRVGLAAGAKRKHQLQPVSCSVLGACLGVRRQLGVHWMEADYLRALEVALRR